MKNSNLILPSFKSKREKNKESEKVKVKVMLNTVAVASHKIIHTNLIQNLKDHRFKNYTHNNQIDLR